MLYRLHVIYYILYYNISYYLIMRRRSYNKDTPPTTTTQLGPIYDDVKLPETSEQKEIIELQGNTAYDILIKNIMLTLL